MSSDMVHYLGNDMDCDAQKVRDMPENDKITFLGCDDHHGHLIFRCPCGATIQKDLSFIGTMCERRDLYFDEADLRNAINAAVKRPSELSAWAVAWADYHGKKTREMGQEYGETSRFYYDHYIRHMAFMRLADALKDGELDMPPEQPDEQ